MRCPSCGCENRQGAKFCNECGAPLALRCTACGIENPGVQCRNFAANVLWFLGYPDRALRRSPEAATLARELAHPHSLLFALTFAALLHQFRRERSAVQEWVEAIETLCTEQELARDLSWNAMPLRGWALDGRGQKEEWLS